MDLADTSQDGGCCGLKLGGGQVSAPPARSDQGQFTRRRRARLADVCRLRNHVVIVLRLLLKTITELHEPGWLVTAVAQINLLCCCQVVYSANSDTGRYYKALSSHDDHALSALLSLSLCLQLYRVTLLCGVAQYQASDPGLLSRGPSSELALSTSNSKC